MEILSTGDKIKRARIYEGITLKELCEDKLSISKMSCIENGKIKADEGIIRHIAKKLNLDYEYLIQDIDEQIRINIKKIEQNNIIKRQVEEFIQYNLKVAIEYEYYDLAFELIHRLFAEYVKSDNNENMNLIISQYNELYQKETSRENTLTYYEDMARFFQSTKEYFEAINYYNKILELLDHGDLAERKRYLWTCFNKGICYMSMSDIKKAYLNIEKAVNNVEYADTDMEKGKIYHLYSSLSILLLKVNSEKYIDKSYKYLKNDSLELAKAKGEIGKSYYEIGQNEKGKKEIIDAIELCPKEDKEKLVEFLIKCVETFYINKEYDIAVKIIEEALNLSICCDNAKLIERAYYYKGMLLQKKGFYNQAETYMNISTDYFLKYANKEETYKRYNEMAELYYNLGELREAIKYFILAMNLEKNNN